MAKKEPLTEVMGEKINFPDKTYHVISEMREGAPRFIVEGDLMVYEFSAHAGRIMKRSCGLNLTMVGQPFYPQSNNLLDPGTIYMYLYDLDFRNEHDVQLANEVITEARAAEQKAILRL